MNAGMVIAIFKEKTSSAKEENNHIFQCINYMNRYLIKNIQMANRQMKTCSILHVTGEMQFKIMIRCYCTHLRELKLKEQKSANPNEDVEQQEFPFISWKNAKWYNHF